MSKPKVELHQAVDIAVYCIEEVRRQQRGYEQMGWMMDAWMTAIEAKASRAKLSHGLITHWAHQIERFKNQPLQYRGMTVRVGDRICPPPQELHNRMERWLDLVPDMTPIEAYKEFEFIHPFEDGNGRTGKIILNWLNDSLRKPIFPPHDLFGGYITNP